MNDEDVKDLFYRFFRIIEDGDGYSVLYIRLYPEDPGDTNVMKADGDAVLEIFKLMFKENWITPRVENNALEGSREAIELLKSKGLRIVKE